MVKSGPLGGVGCSLGRGTQEPSGLEILSLDLTGGYVRGQAHSEKLIRLSA